jgi:hypothetical protein
MSLIDPEAYFESVLPERGEALAVPLTGALRGFVNDQIDSFLASDTFHRLWLDVNERAHQRAIAVLEGDTGDLQIEGNDVQMDFVPVINRVLSEIADESPEIFGRIVDLPTVTVDDTPQDAIAKIEHATGRDLPDDFGQFAVFEAQRLQQVQDAVSLFERLVVATVVAAVLLRRLGLRLEDDVVDLVSSENRDAVKVVVDAFISSLLASIAWILGIAVLVSTVALLTGPYRWAAALRLRVASIGGGFGRDALRLGGIGLAILVPFAADLSWFGLVVLTLVVGGFELAVRRIASEPRGSPSPRDG